MNLYFLLRPVIKIGVKHCQSNNGVRSENFLKIYFQDLTPLLLKEEVKMFQFAIRHSQFVISVWFL